MIEAEPHVSTDSNSPGSQDSSVFAATEIGGVDITPPADFLVNFERRAAQLRMLPAVAREALEVAKDPDCTIHWFTSIVEQDVKLASDILKIANSTLYSPKTPIISLHVAVVRLGFNECQNMILASCIASLLSRISMEQQSIRAVLEQHSLATGYLATYLNREFRFGFRGDEFTAGLMHDFGRILFSVVLPDQFLEIDSLEFDESSAVLAHEIQVVGTNHCRLGAWFALQNHLPTQLAEVILHHHQPELAQEARHLTALITVADHMASHMQRFGEAESYVPEFNPGLPVLTEFGTPYFPSRFCEIAQSLMEEVQRDIQTSPQD